MSTHNPTVSVIIPAYNQAHFLSNAVQSVLAQTFDYYEIIVVNDGSTDDTETVAKSFGDKIRYMYQENRGLAGARNTGIRHATGEYIALLDSDDVWLPDFLETMMALAKKDPDAAVFFCAAQCMDENGNDLPQKIHVKSDFSSKDFYETLVFANFIIPSTVVMKRAVVVEADSFDESLRSCEDWDLWLTLVADYQFVGLDECLIRYRIHGSSLSTDPTGMHRAATAVINKHFGLDDGHQTQWSDSKRIAYGGLYNYQAWTSILRCNDWDAAAQYLQLALLANPLLAQNTSVFYEMLLGTQPPGYRGTPMKLDLAHNVRNLQFALDKVFVDALPAGLEDLKQQTYSTTYEAAGVLAYNTHQPGIARSYLWRALINQPQGARVRRDLLFLWMKATIKSIFGRSKF